MTRIMILYMVVLSVLALLPLIWQSNIELELTKFTEEWYKALFSLFQIFVAFIAFTFVYERMKALDDQQQVQAGIERVRVFGNIVSKPLSSLKLFNEGTSADWQNDPLRGSLHNLLHQLDIHIRALPSLGGYHRCPSAAVVFSSYDADVAHAFKHVESACRERSCAFARRDQTLDAHIITILAHVEAVKLSM